MTLEASSVALGSVSGNVNIVNAPGGSLTSVVLVPQSVFDTTLERGPIPLGLRAPGLPDAPSINGQFFFDQVPLAITWCWRRSKRLARARSRLIDRRHEPPERERRRWRKCVDG